MLIVETVDAAKKRVPAYAHDKVISLADIAMYTDAEEVPLSNCTGRGRRSCHCAQEKREVPGSAKYTVCEQSDKNTCNE